MKTRPTDINRSSHRRSAHTLQTAFILASSIAALIAAPSAQAASAIWSATPADALWSNPANWSVNPVPGVGDTATFGSGSLVTTIDTGDISLAQIAVTATTAYMIGTSVGTGSITFGDGTTTALNNSGQTNTIINANIILGTAIASNTTFTSGVNRTTTLAGSIMGGTGGTAAAKILTLSPTSNANSFITVSGAISDGGATSLALSKGGSGTVNLTNANNSFTGGLTVSSGTVNVSSLGALGSATTGLITLGTGNQSPGTLNFTGSPGSLSRQVQIGSGGGTGGATIRNNAINGSSPLIFTNPNFNAQTNNGAGGPRVLTLGGANTDANEIQGVIRNNTGGGAAVALTKADAGNWTLSGNNTYTGVTTVTAGTLFVSGSIVGSTTTVSGGTLGGSGGTTGALNLTAGGTLAPGASIASIGTLNTGELSLTGTATFALDIRTNGTPTTDLLAVTGGLSLDGANSVALSITDLDAAAFTSGSLPFITYTTGWTGGVFSVAGTPILDNGNTFFVSGNEYQIDYDFGGTSVALVAVPEPNVAMTLLGGVGMLLGLRRRRGVRSARAGSGL